MNFTAVAQSKWFDSSVCLSKYVVLSCSDVEISEAVNQPLECFLSADFTCNQFLVIINFWKILPLLSMSNKWMHVFLGFFSVWVFFHEHSRFIGQQGKGEGIYLTPLYHFHPLDRHLDISQAIAAKSSPLHIASSRTRSGNVWFLSASC